jgi:hypothetical protein
MGMTRFSSQWILSHSTWYKFSRSGQFFTSCLGLQTLIAANWRNPVCTSNPTRIILAVRIAPPEFLSTLCNLSASASSDVIGFGAGWLESAIFERA